jgi:hypothetical protein
VATDNSTQIGIYGNSGSIFSVDSISVKEVNPIGTGFSSRKINSDYTGYAMRVRNNDDNIEAEVSFDSNNEISLDSPVKATSMNLVGHSENFGSWIASSVDLTSGQSDPFGGNNAYIIYLKPLDTTRTRIFVGNGGVTNQGFDVTFSSLGVPSTILTTGATNITYTPVGTDGWYRVSGVIKSDVTTSDGIFIIYPDYSGNTKSLYAYGAQLEETVYESTGTEKITDGGFDNGLASWVAGGDSSLVSVENGAIRINSPDSIFTQIYQDSPVTAGKKYVITADLTVTSGGVAIGATQNPAGTEVTYTSSGSISQTFVATSTSIGSSYYIKRSGAANVLVDNVSVLEYDPELQDYTQTPVISDAHNSTSATNLREFAGKENLLDYSEDFSQWTVVNSVALTSNQTDPLGGQNAYLLQSTTTSGSN